MGKNKKNKPQTAPAPGQQPTAEQVTPSTSRQQQPSPPQAQPAQGQGQPKQDGQGQQQQKQQKQQPKPQQSQQQQQAPPPPSDSEWGPALGKKKSKPQQAQEAQQASATPTWGAVPAAAKLQQQAPQKQQPHPKQQQQQPQQAQPKQQAQQAQPKQQAQQAQPIQQAQPKQQPQPAGPSKSVQQQQSQSGLSKSDDVTKQMATVSLRGAGKQSAPQWPICPSKGAGTLGRKVLIETNYLALDVKRIAPNAYHYDVTMEPDKPNRLMRKVFHEFRRINFPKISIAFDGKKNAYSPEILKIPLDLKREVTIIDDETGQKRLYLVAIKEAKDNVIDLSCLNTYHSMRQWEKPMRALQCLDTVLKDSLTGGVQVGRSFFTYPARPIDLGDFYELWTGLFQSTILGSRPYINVDIAHKAFPSSLALIDIANRMGDRYDMFLDRHLRGLRILYALPGNDASKKGYKYNALGDIPAKEKFKVDDRDTNVLDYFRTKNIQLRNPNYRCIRVGNAVRSISLPMEFCSVAPGQAIQKKCTETQTRNMIRESATSTDIRKQKILDILNKLQPGNSETVRQFGLQVSNTFISVNARILNPPTLEYGQRRTIIPKDGVWRGEGVPFISPQVAPVWGCLIMDDRTRKNDVEEFCKMILRCSVQNQMDLSPNYFIDTLAPNRGRPQSSEQIDACLQRIRKNQCKVLFCIIPDRGETYASIKQAAELRCGVLTQCIKANTIFRKRGDGSTISNILLKVNAKLNGVNHKLQTTPVLDGKCMVIGADVTHPSPEQTRIPSVVGVTASHDANAFQYNLCYRLQDPRKEMIEDFENIIAEQLQYYQNKNKFFPEKLLYYRDGVSEGQFQEVMSVELSAMYRACQKVKPNYKPKITMVVVQKRHHTRFFPGKSGIGDRRNNNVPAGTIVDTEIVHPNETQFYLVSHQSIQGVAKPTKYCVLHDDSNLKIDDLQTLTYNLCHLFTRCNRSVSYPAPTYYAHLVAARGKAYIEGANLAMGNLKNEYKKRTIREDIVKGHPMYFV